MYRHVWRYMKSKKKKLLYTLAISIFILAVVICIFPLKFAKFLYDGNVNGIAYVPAQNAIRITQVVYSNGYNGNVEESIINDYHGTTMDSKIVLGDSINSSMTYIVTLKNYDLSSTIFNGVNITNDNDDVEITISGINIGDKINAGATRDINVRYSYKSTVTNINNTISNNNIIFNFDNSAYSYQKEELLNGNEYVDTGIKLFSMDNASKDFEISFVLESLPDNQIGQGIIFGNIDETGEPYSGIAVKYDNGISLIANVDASHKKEEHINLQVGNKMIIRRINNILSYSIDGGEHYINYTDFTGFTDYTDYPATFGAGLDSTMIPFRYYNGTLSNLSVKIVEPSYYTVKFISVSGQGTMPDQKFNVKLADNISANTFTKDGYIFDHWNTQYNGTGVNYNDQQLVKGIGQANAIVMLFAQWRENPHYKVRFDSNGGTGEMNDQDFVYGTAQNLTSNTFAKDGLEFLNWNTESDGTGKTYKDGESVINLTTEENGIVTLYAMYGQGKYEYTNQLNFDGTSTSLNTYNHLFDTNHIHRNFEISFDIVSVGTNASSSTLFNSMKEDSQHPGLVLSVYDSSRYELSGNFGDVHITNYYDINISKVVIRNINNQLYFSSDGINFEHLGDTSGITEIDAPIVFGSSLDSNDNPWRYFSGSIKNIVIYYY